MNYDKNTLFEVLENPSKSKELFVITVIKRLADEYPNKIAIVDVDNTKYTFKELYDISKQIAYKLKECGVKKGDFISIELSKSKEYVAARFSIWMLGAVYVAVSDKTPQSKLKFIYDNCNVKLKITKEFIKELDNLLNANEFTELDDEDEILLLYTSGTTGNPKGVLHNVKFLRTQIKRICLTNRTIGNFASYASIEFIGSIANDLTSLLSNNTVYILPEEYKKDLNSLKRFLNENNIVSMFLPPHILNIFDIEKTSLKQVYTGTAPVSNLYSDKCIISQNYGSTEAGVITFMDIDKKYENTPIGKPIGKEKIYILDENLNETNNGEIYFSGDFTIGYISEKEKNEETFINNPFKEIDGNDRLLRTRDIGQKLDNGDIIFLNRDNLMIKIHGNRVEPREVEKNILKIKDIKEVVVKGFKNKDKNDEYIVAYYTTNKNISIDELKDKLKDRIPNYMIPSFFVKLDKIPRNKNGKIDYPSLKSPDIDKLKEEYVAPKNDIEKTIVEAFSKVFGLKIGINDNFTELGGDSLKAIEILNIINDKRLHYFNIIQLNTPKAIADYLINFEDNDLDISFEELKNIELPLKKEYSLRVWLDEVRYEFMINIRFNEDRLVILGSEGLTIDNKHDRNRPLFHRYNWNFEASTIAYNDPTLYLSNNIYAGWGFGTENTYYLRNIAIILKLIMKKYGIKHENTVIFGSSAAGFMAIQLGTMIKDTTVIANVPQFNIMDHEKWDHIRKTILPNYNDKEIKELFKERIDVVEMFIKENYIAKSILILGLLDSDLNDQDIPFIRRLEKLPNYQEDKSFIKLIFSGQKRGHDQLSQEDTIYLIKQALNKNLMNFNKEIEESNLYKENLELKAEVERLRKIEEEVLSSNSWKITKPLRKATDLFKK